MTEEFSKTTLPGSGIFDENAVEFVLQSGQSKDDQVYYQTDAIFASATMKESGEAIPLKCTWYNIPKTEDSSK